ncbi:MAG: NAD(P)-dependent oxidoreductase [Chloroflexi bacterium]|nr:NAD(P)-dependent oxidoreductase [Chloroflexota bacterium]MDA1219629.1 NAD(P)-dependent oxidoreductase [Chloroflexota bacterium]
MPKPKIAFVVAPTERANFVKSLAPPDMDVTLVDLSLSQSEKIELCKDADAIISSEVTVDVLKECPRVKIIQTLSAGFDRLDARTIGEMGIPIANNGGANSIAVSEQTIALMIAVSKKTMLHWDMAVRQRRWRGDLGSLPMFEITDKTVGIVGLGRVGKQVAKRLKGFDTRTIYYDVDNIPKETQSELNAEPVAFEELIRESDIITMHVPLNRQTRAMISHRELEAMKPTAYLINASRGPVVDEKALYQALQSGKIAGAGLDVLEEEPTPVDNPLFELDNVVITPHMAAASYETDLRASDFAYTNIRRVLAGETPQSLITLED